MNTRKSIMIFSHCCNLLSESSSIGFEIEGIFAARVEFTELFSGKIIEAMRQWQREPPLQSAFNAWKQNM
jgi:hypothetical protein